jgi:hypothetical protein
MKKRILLPIILAGALATAGFLGFKAYSTVRAAVEIPAVSPVISVHGIGGGGQSLADALGITLDELNTARTNAFNAGVDEALAQGLITQAQADDLKSRSETAPFGRGLDRWLAAQGIDFNSLLAEELGISVDELNAARVKAQNTVIDQAVTDGRITQEQADLMKGKLALSNDSTFVNAMKTAFTNAVNQAVQSGLITQAQADAILKQQESDNFNFMGKMGGPGGFGVFGGLRRGHGEFGPGLRFPDNQTTPDTGTQTPTSGL